MWYIIIISHHRPNSERAKKEVAHEKLHRCSWEASTVTDEFMAFSLGPTK